MASLIRKQVPVPESTEPPEQPVEHLWHTPVETVEPAETEESILPSTWIFRPRNPSPKLKTRFPLPESSSALFGESVVL